MTQPAVVATLDSGAFTTSTRTVTTGTVTGWTPKQGDIVLLFVQLPLSGTGLTITPPAGWVNPLSGAAVAAGNSTGTAANMAVVYHLVTAAEESAGTTSWTLTNLLDTAKTGRRIVVIVRGADPENPVEAAAAGASTTTGSAAAIPDLMPTRGGGLAIGAAGGNSGSASRSFAAPSDPWANTLNCGVSMTRLLVAVQYKTPTTAGITLTGVTLTESANDDWVTCAIAFAPVPDNSDDFFALF